MATVDAPTATADAPAAVKLVGLDQEQEEQEAKDEAHAGRSCRDLLVTAASWYTFAKEYVPAAAKPMVSKLETKVATTVSNKLEQYPETVSKVGAFLDDKVIPTAEAAVARVAETTHDVLANEAVQKRVIEPSRAAVKTVVAKTTELSDRAQNLRAKAHDLVHDAASAAVGAGLDAFDAVTDAVTDRVDQVTLAGREVAGRVRKAETFIKDQWKSPPTRSQLHASAVALAELVDNLVDRALPEDQEGKEDAEEAISENTEGEEADDAVVDPPKPSAEGTSATDQEETAQQQAEEEEECTDEPEAEEPERDIAALARNIVGKVSFRMKKRVVRKLEEAKGTFQLRTQKLLHTTNLIQYARQIAEDERYAKLSTVLGEAAKVVEQSPAAIVRTVTETINNSHVTSGIELFHKGEETARLAIVTTGELTAKCRQYSDQLAARIRERIAALEEQRTQGIAPQDEEQEQSAFAAAVSKYLRSTATTGAATLFVFRDDVSQVMTYAYTHGTELAKNRAPQQLTATVTNLMNPAWTAVTKLSAARANVQNAIQQATAKGREAIQQASTWTNVAFTEFARTHRVIGRHELPESFTSGLSFVLQRMINTVSEEDAREASAPEEEAEEEGDMPQVSEVDPVQPGDAAVEVATGDKPEEDDAREEVQAKGATDGSDEQASEDADDLVVQLDEEQSNAEWYYSLDPIEQLPDDEDDDVAEIAQALQDASLSGMSVDSEDEHKTNE